MDSLSEQEETWNTLSEKENCSSWHHLQNQFTLSQISERCPRENGAKCRVLPAPFGVFIKKDDRNYFEPDISVVCDREKLDQEGCHGAPDWLIEIVSPSSRKMDYIQKPQAYMSAGVREYWIVDYDRKTISAYCFEESAEPKLYSFFDRIPSAIYADFSIDFAALSEYLW